MQNITVYADIYNWPQYPSLHVGSDGIVHAFWYQQFHDDCMTPSGEAVYYKTLENGAWVDRTFTLLNHIGTWTRMSLDRFGSPSFVWAEQVSGSEDVMLACYEPTAQISDFDGDRKLRISAGPNPFGSTTTLTYETTEAGRPDLSIIDPGGRLVLRLAEGDVGPGAHRIQWDGRDTHGRALPAGAYRARIATGGKVATCGVVLLR